MKFFCLFFHSKYKESLSWNSKQNYYGNSSMISLWYSIPMNFNIFDWVWTFQLKQKLFLNIWACKTLGRIGNTMKNVGDGEGVTHHTKLRVSPFKVHNFQCILFHKLFFIWSDREYPTIVFKYKKISVLPIIFRVSQTQYFRNKPSFCSSSCDEIHATKLQKWLHLKILETASPAIKSTVSGPNF